LLLAALVFAGVLVSQRLSSPRVQPAELEAPQLSSQAQKPATAQAVRAELTR
jgi:hypothetical protein